jgi:hypothetical protein
MPGSMQQLLLFSREDLGNLFSEVYKATKESMVLEWMLFNLFQNNSFPELPKEIINKPVEIIKYYGNGPVCRVYSRNEHGGFE